MRILLKATREGLGRLMVFADYIFPPKIIKRNEKEQKSIDKETKSLKLYHIYACPFCIKTRRVIKRLNLNIETRSVQNEEFRKHLPEVKVPCLRIENGDNIELMYESNDIIAYLEKKFN